MKDGYQRQLVYKLEDGSFSAFGPDVDRRGSIWITAQTMSTFRRSQQFIDVDESVIGRSLSWLQSQQQDDGSFKESGKVVNKLMQEFDKDKGSVALTSFVVLSFLDNKYK